MEDWCRFEEGYYNSLIRIVVCGESGAGITTLSEALLGMNSESGREVSHAKRSSTSINWTGWGTVYLRVVDTPGYGNHITKEAYLEEIEMYVENSDVLLFCIPSTEDIEDAKEIIEALLQMRRCNAFPRIIFVLTKTSVHDVRSHTLQNVAMPEVLGSIEVPVVVSGLVGKDIPGDTCTTPWLARMFYEILDVTSTSSYFTSLAQCHPHLKNETLCLEEIRRECSNGLKVNLKCHQENDLPPDEQMSLIVRVSRATDYRHEENDPPPDEQMSLIMRVEHATDYRPEENDPPPVSLMLHRGSGLRLDYQTTRYGMLVMHCLFGCPVESDSDLRAEFLTTTPSPVVNAGRIGASVGSAVGATFGPGGVILGNGIGRVVGKKVASWFY